jgi:phosphomannomutase
MSRALARRATAGGAAWLRAQGRSGPVVVGRDARHGSAACAEDTARVLAGAGFPVLVLPRPLPTPVTAFATRHLGAVAGVMITASHNPPQDNGYKLYLGDGAQIVPPVDEQVSTHIDAVRALADVPLGDDGIVTVTDEVVEAYLDGAAALLRPGGRDVRVAYTAMHGVGAAVARGAFARAGFAPLLEVAEQVEPDPDFPTVAFPNPEEPGALDLAVALAVRERAHVVVANDPDADRLGVAVPDDAADGGWRTLTGDEIGCLLADDLLRTGACGRDDVLATTVVSSRLLSAMARDAGVTYGEALTGFKWVVRTVEPGQRLALGYEEALGYCVGDLVRDKDGITAALAMAALVARLLAEGSSVMARLDELSRRYGVHVTRQRSIRLQGGDWLARVRAAMASVRRSPPEQLAGRVVRHVEDLAQPGRFPVPSDVLVWELDGARAVIRPSGTEPKLKAYVEAIVAVDDDDLAEARATARRAVEELHGAIAALLAEHGL